MKKINVVAFGFLLLLILSGCDNILTNKNKSSLEERAGDPGKLLINSPLPIITSVNASNYLIEGLCNHNLGDVKVIVKSPEVIKFFPCSSKGEFSGVLDLRAITSNPAQVSATQGSLKTVVDIPPVNDQKGPVTAPVATAPGSYVGGGNIYNMSIVCSEEGELVKILGAGLDPSTQFYTCTEAGEESVPLSLLVPVETQNPNNLTLSSEDKYGNPSETNSSVNLPVDTKGPEVSISNTGDIVEGHSAQFTITVTEPRFTPNYTVNTTGVETKSYSCTSNPCNIVTEALSSTGSLTLSLEANSISDDVGNVGDSVLRSSSLTVNVVGTLLISNNPLPVINTQNASAYLISGDCDGTLGNVKIKVTSPEVTKELPCSSSGHFSGVINISDVSSNPAMVSITQDLKTVSADPQPINDQTPIMNAPMVADQTPKRGMSASISIGCNEVGEVVTFTNNALNPEDQTYTCVSQGTENINLTFKNAVETENPNNVIVTSKDANGNTTVNNDSFNLPIDNIAPAVSVASGSNIIQGDSATFTVTVIEGTGFSSFTPSVSNGNITSGACTSSPCNIAVSDVSAGTLTLTVAKDSVIDSAGNTNAISVSGSLTVQATTLSINEPLPIGNTNNKTVYPISGNCDAERGDVKITIGTPNIINPVSCAGSPGTYSTTLDISEIISSTLSVSVEQNNNIKTPGTTPINDQDPIMSAPAVADQAISKGTNLTVFLECNESGEIVTFTNNALNPEDQTYTCIAQGTENTNLTFKNAVETENPNNVIVTSKDANGNTTVNSSLFNLPIDNIAPAVSIASGSNIIQGDSASFTVTVIEGTGFNSFIPSVSSGNITSGACISSPCNITVSGVSAGTLILTVAKDSVIDSAGNTNAASVSRSLTVQATTLSINGPLPIGNTDNKTTYPISGNCDAERGDVKITIGTPDVIKKISCAGSPGAYSTTLNISSVEANPMSVKAEQNNNTFIFSPSPVNDQDGPVSAPTATAPGSVVGGANYNLAINCNESGEVVSITGSGIAPTPQTYTCTSSGSQNFPLSLQQGVNFSSPNNFTLSSKDKYGNPAGSTTSVNIPIDTLGPTVAVTNGGDIVEGTNASFTITVADDHPPSNYSYVPVVSSGTSTPSTCTSNPCNISVSGPNVGTLTVSVTANSISDAVGNTGPTANKSSSLTVIDDPSPTITGVITISTDGDVDNWYEASDTVTLAVQFSENITVNTTGGVPRIPVTLTSGSKTANYVSGTGTNSLRFSFSVASGDEQCNGTPGLGALNLNGSTIKDSIGQDSINSGLASSVSGVQIDTASPIVSAVSLANDALNDRVNDKAVMSSWTRSDNCTVSRTDLAIGTHNGSSCLTPESIRSFVNIGSVSSIQPISGTAPFNLTNTFNLNTPQSYCTTIRVTDSAGNSKSSSSSGWTLFYPTNISDLVAWYDSGDPKTLKTNTSCTTNANNGESVACVVDKSSEGNNLKVSLGTKPVYSSTNQALDFLDGGLRTNSDQTLDFSNGGTYFVVAQSNSNDKYQAVSSTRFGEDGLFTLRTPDDTIESWVKWPLLTSQWNEAVGKTGYTDTDFIVMESIDPGTSRVTSYNGTETTQTKLNGIGDVTDRLAVGSHVSGNNSWDGNIYEVIYFDRGLTSTERTQVYNYLNNKWN